MKIRSIIGDTLDASASSVSDVLALPASFGSIFLGETFASYLCIVNESRSPVARAGIKAELQTQTQRFTLADTVSLDADSPPVASLGPAKTAEFLITHEVKELGVHILVCSVHYTTRDGDHKSFRKFYKFQVLNPLSVKTKVHAMPVLEGIEGGLFLEAQIQNVSGVPMYLERLKFEASDVFSFVDMTLEYQDADSHTKQSVFADTALLNNSDSRQYLFSLTPKTPNDPLAKTTPTLGKLDLQWRTTLGQQGRLQTSQLSRKVAPQDPLRVTVLNPPTRVRAEEPFTLRMRLWNNSPSDSVDATVQFVKSRMSSVLLLGAAERKVGAVGPLGFADFDVDFFPLLGGVQKVTGLRVLDGRAGVVDVDMVCEVNVG
ncbi:hypothetical protein BC830DRAFT_525535 [Chytriomyces sp. MP71]|nr:hypothetical protein BC830DRAFT_525535 [Chytriomyces sp. MP71]